MSKFKKIGLTRTLGIQTIFKSEDNNNTFLFMNSHILHNEPNMTGKSKNILCYILSRPPQWEVSITDISANIKEGRDAIRSGLKELEEKGYIIRFNIRDPKGKIVSNITFAYDLPQKKNRERIISAAKKEIEEKIAKFSDDELLELTTYGILVNGKSNTSNNNTSNKDLNKCMNGSSSTPKIDNLHASTEEQIIMEKVFKGCEYIEEPKFFNEIYTMLLRKFKNQLDPRIIELAFSRYLEKRVDLYQNKEKEITNPTGWFYDAYRDAIKIYKAQRYANKREQVKIGKELKKIKNMHFSQKDKFK
ncbi:helix-turn-helix domain-containing protein [Gracilibacillus massiliensis]|uniref:helix-turn-helix domain-containing protein n=1 Tax=Gracilibacillus massiliensis TaxID=1564956 RepID=UPI00071CD847|nr:helix-turn-helix domain-containing protein [Gracilibacillus massiliensis]